MGRIATIDAAGHRDSNPQRADVRAALTAAFPPSPVVGLVAVGTIASFILSLHAIDAKSIWADEAVSVATATGSMGDFMRRILFDDQTSAFYYILLRGWMAMFGDSEAAARSLSALLVAASVPVLYLTAARVAGLRAGIYTVLLSLCNAFVLHYSQEARAYALAYLLMAIATLLAMRLADRPSREGFVLYGIAAVLAMYAHFYALFGVVAQLVWLSLRLRSTRPRQAWLLMACIGAAVLPLAVSVVLGPSRAWIGDLSVRAISHIPALLTGAPRGVPWQPLLYAIGLSAALVAAWMSWDRRGRSIPPEVLLAACLLAPVVGSITISLVKPILVGRYLMIAVPGLIALTGIGLARMRPMPLGALVMAGILWLGVIQVAGWYQAVPKEDWRTAAATIVGDAEPGDAILVVPPAAFRNLALLYYIQRAPGGETRPPVLRLYSPDQVASLVGTYDRVWMVSWERGGRAGRLVDNWDRALLHDYTLVDHRRQPTVDVDLYAQGEP